jgi:hypothetical protein
MTTIEVSEYLKLYEITICKYAAQVRSRVFGLEGSGDSIREGIEKPRYFPFMFVIYHKFR